MEQLSLVATVRELTGKKVNRLRHQGIIPAVLDQKGQESINIQVPIADLNRVLHTDAGANVLLKLTVEGGPRKVQTNAIIKRLYRNPVSHRISHVDFHGVSLKEKINTHVPVMMVGESRHIKDQGGRVEQVLHEIEIRSLPDHIPGHLEVDISRLSPGDIIHAADIPLPDGVELHSPADSVIVIGRGKQVEMVEEAPEAAPAEEAAEAPAEAAEGQ